MSANQLALVPDVGRAHDELDRFYTPQRLADECVRRVVGLVGASALRIVVEPSVGGGAFARAVRKHTDGFVFGVDVDPNAPGFRDVDEHLVGDWSTLDYSAGGADLVIGNPPFTGDRAIAHVEASLVAADHVALILPWAPLGGVAQWRTIMHGARRPAWVAPIMPRPWGDHVRETALFIWGPAHEIAPYTRIAAPVEWR